MTVQRKPRTSKNLPPSTTLTSAFHDPSRSPGDRDLSKALGVAEPLWSRLIDEAGASWGPLADQWSFSKALGWTLRLKQPKRVLVYLTPSQSCFLASFALGEKACAAIRQAGVPAAMLALIDAAPKYAEGRGVRIPVSSRTDLEGVLKIAGIKAATK